MNTGSPAAAWPRHYTLILLCFLAQLIAYFDRVNISVASIAMQAELGWTDAEKGLALASFYVGYMSMQIIGGYLANRFGGRITVFIALFFWSLLTVVAPVAATMSLSIFIATRVVLGLGEASLSPGVLNLFSRWVPESIKSTALAIYSAAATLGTLLALIITGYLTQVYGWQASFYVFGVLGILLSLAWYRIVRDDPAKDESVTEAELAAMPYHGRTGGVAPRSIPWRRLLGNGRMLSLLITYFGVSWGLYVFIAWLPSYFKDVQGLNISSAGIYSAAPWLAMSIGMILAGSFSDSLIRAGKRRIVVRKSVGGVGLFGSAVTLVGMQYASTPGHAVGLMVIALTFLSFAYAAVVPTLTDIAPKYSDVAYGVMNTFGALPGIVGVAVAGWLVQVTGSYESVFVLTAAVQLAAGAFYVAFASDKDQFASS